MLSLGWELARGIGHAKVLLVSGAAIAGVVFVSGLLSDQQALGYERASREQAEALVTHNRTVAETRTRALSVAQAANLALRDRYGSLNTSLEVTEAALEVAEAALSREEARECGLHDSLPSAPRS